MQDVEFTTSTGRLALIVGFFALLSMVAIVLDDATYADVVRVMSAVISSMALVMFFAVK